MATAQLNFGTWGDGGAAWVTYDDSTGLVSGVGWTNPTPMPATFTLAGTVQGQPFSVVVTIPAGNNGSHAISNAAARLVQVRRGIQQNLFWQFPQALEIGLSWGSLGAKG